MAKKKITISLILLVAIGIILTILSYPHLCVIKNMFSHTENIISTREINDFDLRNGDKQLLINNAIKKNYKIRFNGNIKKLETLYIGKGEKEWNSSYLKLTNDSIFAFINKGSIRQNLAEKHNLILSDELSIIINKKVDNAEILLTNKTDTFYTTTKFGGMNNPFIHSVGSEIKVNNFGFVCDSYENDVWIFGDSYINSASPARWPYYIYNAGYKFLCSGLPGGKSIHSYDFLRTALTINKPKYLIWCLGMNDGSDRFFANASWLLYTKKIERLCKENNITLVFGIIPTCPKVINKYKNTYIRKSGYRYIDFEKALLDNNGKWKDGYCADGIHPTEKGAKAMAEQFLKDFPEIGQREM